jgi:drug/metabolite transporter (DMT)-like permease
MGKGGGPSRAPVLGFLVNPFFGIALKILSALSFTLMSAGIKHVSSRFPTGEIVFFRSAFALVPVLAWLGWRGEVVDALRTRNVVGHIRRGLIGSAGMFSGFVALSYLPLPDAVALGYTAPLLVVVLAALILKETVRVYRWTAVAVGFAGVIVMLTPHLSSGAVAGGLGGGPARGAFFALFGALCAAAATVQVRQLTATEKTGAIVFYFQTLTTVLGLATLAWGWNLPRAGDAALLVLIGILGGIGQILLTQSYRYAETSLIAPFEYTTMVWALLIGWLVFGDVPVGTVIIGGAIVVSSGIFVIWRERRLGLQRARSNAAGPPRAT